MDGEEIKNGDQVMVRRKMRNGNLIRYRSESDYRSASCDGPSLGHRFLFLLRPCLFILSLRCCWWRLWWIELRWEIVLVADYFPQYWFPTHIFVGDRIERKHSVVVK